MNQQCYQCHTAHDDNALTAVSGVWLCPKCKSNPSVAVQTYGMLVSSYAPETLTQVRDMVAALEAERDALREALRPFAEACKKVDQVLADAPPLHDIYPSDFIDCDENCMWEAARLYEQATAVSREAS